MALKERRIKQENTKKRYFGILIAIVVGGMALIAAARLMMMGGMVYQQGQMQDWVEELQETGPWSRETIWTTEKQDVYLIGEERENEQGEAYVYVRAFCQNGESWEEAEFAPARSKDKAVFVFSETDKIQGSILLLKDSLNFVVTGTHGEKSLPEGQMSLVLHKLDYQEGLKSLPFAYSVEA